MGQYKYEIEIEGEGGEFIAGKVKSMFLEALEENGIDIEEYATGDMDDEQFECIPEDIRPFDPGCWYDINSFVHATLAHNDATITVWDKEAKEFVYNSSDEDAVELGVGETYGEEGLPQPFSIYDAGDDWEGEVVYTCQRQETGTFFTADLELDEPFDPNKLVVQWVNLNEQMYIGGVVYELDGDKFIQIEGEFGGSDIDGATHELRQL